MKSSGLTLIEILFAALIISVLASLILFSSTESKTTAQVNNIINDFESIRMAYSLLYSEADNDIHNSDIETVRKRFTIDSILKYINDVPDKKKYSLIIDNSGSWFISYRIDDTPDASRIKRKLEGHRKSSGLLGSDDGENLSSLKEYSKQDYVIVKLR